MSDPRPSPTDSLDPLLLERARALSARVRALVLGAGHGVHRSRQLGGGSEFSEFKGYSPGDDLRHLDWKVHGRTDRYVVRQYESDRRTEVHLLLDRSGSMAFGTTGGVGPELPADKWDAARTFALALGFVFLRLGDRVGLTVIGDGGARTIPPRGGERQLLELARQATVGEPAGAGDLSAALADLAIRARKALIIVVSDLLSESDRWLDALGVHTARGREAWVVHVVDPAEISFPYDEPTRFVDLEGAGDLRLNPRELARSYREEFAAFLEDRQTRCLQARVHYLRYPTDRTLVDELGAFLQERTWA